VLLSPDNDQGWLEDGQPDPSVGGEVVDLRPLYAELAGTLRVVVYNGDIDGQVPSQVRKYGTFPSTFCS